jgi:hypothetical protein
MEAFPIDLARAVRRELTRRGIASPALSVLRNILEVMFSASIATEELRPITFRVAYWDPRHPDELPPVLRPTRHSLIHFPRPLALTAPNLKKLAPAADPRTVALTIYAKRGEQPHIWGLIDQQTHLIDFLTHEPTFGGPETPGTFQATVIGPGHILVTWEYETLAELKAGKLTGRALDVFQGGPICDILAPPRSAFVDRVCTQGLRYGAVPTDWDAAQAADLWSSVLRRALLRMQTFRHGGTLLLTPDKKLAALSVKYPLSYDRIRSSVYGCAVADVVSWDAHRKMPTDRAATTEEWARRDQSRLRADYARSELQSCIWFLSQLSRVDGAVVLSPDLNVRGFGAEITITQRPPKVAISRVAAPRPRDLEGINYEHLGTRHRSAIRYCAAVPGSVALVVSQDGDVRAITGSHPRQRVLIWENLRLRKELPTRWPAHSRDGAN